MATRDPGPIPNRWLKCPRKATDFINSKLLAFKTPLGKAFNDKVPEACRWNPTMLFKFLKGQNVKMGLWIDLTNTNRFYDKAEVTNMGCEYLKMKCRGHGETPSEDQTDMFIEKVKQFTTDHPTEMIGIHCTHGFNRTGFLMVAYMVHLLDCSVDAAIREFAKVRPPGIYKQDYINELCRRYGEDYVPQAPWLPEWCIEEEEEQQQDEDDNEEESKEEDTAPNSSKKTKTKKRDLSMVPKPFMAGVQGVVQFFTQPRLRQIQNMAKTMCHWKDKSFPGSQPVSMDLNNIKLLKENAYMVSWKADGTRYMMVIDGEDEVYFVDRDNGVFKVTGLSFRDKRDINRHLTSTLLDGEMVIDKADGKEIPRYLCYDIISLEGEDIGQKPFFPNRLTYIEKEIIKPRHEAMKNGLIIKEHEPFSVRIKPFWDVTEAKTLLGERFASQLSHEPDGLIFQPSKEKYVAGTCTSVLKWKPAHLNSIDFRLKIGVEQGQGILKKKIGQLFTGQMSEPLACIKITKEIKDLDNKIIECKFVNGNWTFMRERTDKSFPNSYGTALAVWNSMKYPVTQEMLLEFIETNAMSNDIMPPPKKVRRL